MAESDQLDTTQLTTTEVARLFRVNRKTITRWVKAGKLPVAYRYPGETGALLFDRARMVELATSPAQAVPA